MTSPRRAFKAESILAVQGIVGQAWCNDGDSVLQTEPALLDRGIVVAAPVRDVGGLRTGSKSESLTGAANAT